MKALIETWLKEAEERSRAHDLEGATAYFTCAAALKAKLAASWQCPCVLCEHERRRNEG